ncbi:MAG TPA: hypothetical protein VK184_14005 [Nostocaceae cyanobacterium]|nr:hypothetical protein [Nostocaceae cyanobacterium]
MQKHFHCPRKSITPNVNENHTSEPTLCDYCWTEYCFCWSEYCMHQWYEILAQHSNSQSNKRSQSSSNGKY